MVTAWRPAAVRCPIFPIGFVITVAYPPGWLMPDTSTTSPGRWLLAGAVVHKDAAAGILHEEPAEPVGFSAAVTMPFTKIGTPKDASVAGSARTSAALVRVSPTCANGRPISAEE